MTEFMMVMLIVALLIAFAAALHEAYELGFIW